MKVLYTFLFSLFTIVNVFAQCERSTVYNGQYNADQGVGTYTEISNYSPGEYFRMPVIEGGSYTIQTCGSPIDTQLTLYQGTTTASGSHFAYNDDNGPLCSGTSASINFVPNFTDYVRADVRQYNCQSGGTSSITVRIRQNNNLSITSSNATMAPGETRTLTATPARPAATPLTGSGNRGTFTGVGVSGTTFTAPAVTPGNTQNFTITYTFGYATTTQTIVVDGGPAVITEPFSTYAENATTFTGPNSESFELTGSLAVDEGTGNGTSGDDKWVGTPVGQAIFNNVGSIALCETTKAFQISELDVWTSINGGTSLQAGNVKFIGNLQGGGSVNYTTLVTPTDNTTGYDEISFVGTPLEGQDLISLEFELQDGLSYLAVDDFTYSITDGLTASNSIPTVSDVTVSGNRQTTQTISSSYDYFDCVDTESGTTFQWYRADDENGTNRSSISGATASTYVTGFDDIDKYISLDVTPANANGTGNPSPSTSIGPITTAASGLEDFEDETAGLTTFNESGVSFAASGSNVQIGSFTNGGWDGTQQDDQYLDNDSDPDNDDGATLTFQTASGDEIQISSFYVWIALGGGDYTRDANSPITITGSRDGSTVFNINKSSGFETTSSPYNGFTLIDLTTEGGTDNSTVLIDELTITSSGVYDYIAIDAISFTVPTNAPVLLSTSPVDDFVDVAINTDISLVFDENIVLGSGTIQIIDLDDGSSSFTIDAESPGSEATVNNQTLTISPGSNLENETNYSIQVAATAIRDVFGNEYQGILDNTTLNFTTVEFIGGLQIASADTSYVIDFDTTVAGVNNGAFQGTGLSPSPVTGQLDSNGIRVEGLSDGLSDFGDTSTSGGFIGGTSTGGVTTGGLYAFDVSNGGTPNIALGVQPDGDDLTPGAIVLRFQNRTGSAITSLDVAYELLVRNDASGASSVGFEHGGDFNSTSNVAGLLYQTPEAAGIFSGEWRSGYFQTTISVNIPDGGTYYFKWNIEDISGTGPWDELAFDNIEVIANASSAALNISGDYEEMKVDGTLALNSPVNVYGRLDVSGGSLTTNGNLTMKSINYTAASTGLPTDVIRTAVVEPILNGGSITGDVTVEQYYPPTRAFRFLNSPVRDVSGTIYDNWQEGGNTIPGLGTHITGGTTSDGFDQSISGNPSAFIYDPAGTTGAAGWVAFGTPSTTAPRPNSYPMLPSIPVRMLIRGDRTVSLVTQNVSPTATTLRSTGELVVGSYTIDGNTSNEQLAFGSDGSYYVAPNMYQSQMDLSLLLNASNSEDINTSTFWYYLPATQNYVAFDLATDTDVNGVTKLIQPSQSVFVQTSEASGSVPGYSPSLTYSENMKVNTVQNTATYSQPEGRYAIRLLDAGATNTNIALDRVLGLINTGYNNGIDSGDAYKLIGDYEQLGIMSNGALLSNERRDHFANSDIVELWISQMDNGSYSFELNFLLPDHDVYLVDNHMNTRTLIAQSQITSHSFNVDLNDAGSFATDRFQLEFETVTLSSGDLAFAKAVQLYPNPVAADVLNIAGLQVGEATVTITNMLGQRVLDITETPSNGQVSISGMDSYKSGIYLVTITQGEQSTSKKIVIK